MLFPDGNAKKVQGIDKSEFTHYLLNTIPTLGVSGVQSVGAESNTIEVTGDQIFRRSQTTVLI